MTTRFLTIFFGLLLIYDCLFKKVSNLAQKNYKLFIFLLQLICIWHIKIIHTLYYRRLSGDPKVSGPFFVLNAKANFVSRQIEWRARQDSNLQHPA